ncbi:cytochrome P450 734A5-like [Andrographis paniculata]|uniref:cytochrome P450 734A5-like n=1 Tax=Andrographis paniculata TaxID=175694 RepID=UPI0021E99EFE|nr:cytochrome P450 734A5-like [Andrographis paniculata]
MGSCIEREINAFLWLSLIAVTTFLLGRLGKVFGLWSKARQLPGPPCSSFYGHGQLFSGTSLTEILYTCHKKYGGVVKLWLGPTQLMVSVADTELIKDVLLKAEDKLPLTGRAFRLAFGESSLFISSFEKVKYQRKSLEARLGGATLLERACSISTQVLDHVVERSQIATGNGGVDCEVVAQHLAFSILGTTIFGDKFLVWSKATVYEDLLMKIAKDACFWASYGVAPFWKHEFWQYKDSCIQLKSLTQELIKECRHTCKSELLQDSGGDGEREHEPCGEIISLMFHGSLTLSALIANILSRLLTHRHVQDKIYSEIVMARKDGTRPDLQTMDGLPTLFATIYESIRLLPAGPLLQRCSLQHDLCLKNGIVIPAAAIVVVPVQLVQMDSLYWGNDASKFNPCRFLSLHDGKTEFLTVPNESEAFLPFGSGARVCIGQKLAVRAISSLFAPLLENYEINLQPGSENNPKPVMNNHVLQFLPSPNIVFSRRST